MTKTALKEVKETIQRRVRNKVRKSLQTIQISADEQEAGEGMVFSKEEDLSCKGKSVKASENIVVDKENAVVRRSKRRTTVAETLTYAESSEEQKTSKSAKNTKLKTKKTVIKPKKVRSTPAKKAEQKTDLSQTKLNFSPVPVKVLDQVPEDKNEPVESEKTALSTSVSSVVTEDSGFHCAGTSQQSSPLYSAPIFKSPDIRSNPSSPYDYDIAILTSETPPLRYWKDLAEERRIALDKALHENELLHDQLEVLEAENSQLKQLANVAEELAGVVQGIID